MLLAVYLVVVVAGGVRLSYFYDSLCYSRSAVLRTVVVLSLGTRTSALNGKGGSKGRCVIAVGYARAQRQGRAYIMAMCHVAVG